MSKLEIIINEVNSNITTVAGLDYETSKVINSLCTSFILKSPSGDFGFTYFYLNRNIFKKIYEILKMNSNEELNIDFPGIGSMIFMTEVNKVIILANYAPNMSQMCIDKNILLDAIIALFEKYK